jgi:hypothetical protein
MTTNQDEIIEKLKGNQVAWKWLQAYERALLLAAKKTNAMVFLDKNGWWQHHSGPESMGVVYRIFKGYKVNTERPNIPLEGMTCTCGYEFNFDGFRTFGMALLEDHTKILICPKCGAKYDEE